MGALVEDPAGTRTQTLHGRRDEVFQFICLLTRFNVHQDGLCILAGAAGIRTLYVNGYTMNHLCGIGRMVGFVPAPAMFAFSLIQDDLFHVIIPDDSESLSRYNVRSDLAVLTVDTEVQERLCE